ncbi:ribonuclease P protein component [Tenggerimyces flavus]|uniref:Ribonuclease P protein component n=1 Tax=Tenggerimyces flavus TaxID=1708749 RepID=A0ABV7YHT0_9ACTN
MRRSDDFATAVRRGRRAGRPTLVGHLGRTSEDASALVGFVVNRAVGNAVVRNAVRRRLRHLLRDRLSALEPGSRFVVRALPAAATATTDQLARDLDAVLHTLEGRGRDRASDPSRVTSKARCQP